MKSIDSTVKGAETIFLEPWELDFLRSGIEPDSQYLFMFSVLYEMNNWGNRWKAVSDQIIEEWRRLPVSLRPVGWIRYLVDIGYLSKKVMEDLVSESPMAVSA
ncbi:MAG: hypothetical protein K9L59_16785 [Desulfobacterales bacterium]|nr:hypothetical protein [Desulfobacterales bacterium]